MGSRLAGKTCLVTGSAQGIGRAIALAFLREGARVVATDLQVERLEAAYRHENVSVARMDVTKADEVAAVAAAYPNVSVLVNCAGFVAVGTLMECDAAQLQWNFDLNVMSMLHTIRAFLPGMRERKDGSIINIASVASTVMAAPNRFAYGVTKAAVLGLTMSVALDFVGDGVRCNAISPGTVDTPSLHDRMSAQGDFEKARAAFIARQPMGRVGTPEEIAEVAVLMASNEAKFMTGSNVVIDGGMSL